MSKHTIILTALGIFIAILLAIGFTQVDNPFSAKDKQYDRIRLQAFSDIKYKVEDYYRLNQRLPDGFHDLPLKSYDKKDSYIDPQTKKEYEYKIVSDTSYQLCTEFSTSTYEENSNGNIPKKPLSSLYANTTDLSHKKGYDCISYATLATDRPVQYSKWCKTTNYQAQEGVAPFMIEPITPTGTVSSEANIVGLWDLGLSTGGQKIIKDTSIYGNDGIAYGTTIVGAGRDFDGESDSIEIPDASQFNFCSGQDYSIEVWVKTTQKSITNNWPQIVVKQQTASAVGGRNGFEVTLHDSTVDPRWYGQLFIANAAYKVYGANDIVDGKWHYLVFQRSGNQLITYEDGKLANTVSNVKSKNDVSSDAALRLGSTSDGSYPYKGTISNLRISNVVRAADAIQLQYTLGKKTHSY